MSKKNNNGDKIYTYRNGKKMYLKKEENTFVTRALPKDMERVGFKEDVEQVSSASTKVKVKKEDIDPAMDKMREEFVTHHAYNLEESDSEFLITDRIMISLKDGSISKIDDILAKYSLIIVQKYSDLDFLLQLTNQTGMNPVKLVVEITENEDGVDLCEHDLNQRMEVMLTLPTDSKYSNQWHLHGHLIDSDFDTRASSRCEEAWNALGDFGDKDIVIGITDDGCRLNHPDFDSPGKFATWGYLQGQSLIDRASISADSGRMYESGSNHGTSCCGVTAADVDAVLTVGGAPNCRLLPIKWESNGTSLYISDSKLMTVLNFVSDKVDVLSNSWGSATNNNHNSFVLNKIRQLATGGGRRGKGIVFIWAAGNSNCPIQHSGNIDIPYTNGWRNGNWVGVRTSKTFQYNLVGEPGVMLVAALASNAQRSHYSNYGDGISICAPSSNSHAYWRLDLSGLGIMTTTGNNRLWSSKFGGTSSATPLVAGIAGLVISANPGLTAIEVVSILQRTASKDLDMTPYRKTPSSSFDPNPTWDVSPIAPHDAGNFKSVSHADGTWSSWFGFGKVDAEAAVLEAKRLLGGSGNTHRTITLSESPNVNIPDNNNIGIKSTIQVQENGILDKIEVKVDLEHSYIGDLVLTLKNPQSVFVVLHNRKGSSSNNIKKTYDIDSSPLLSNFIGNDIQGDWILEIQDLAAVDIGKLSSWELTFKINAQQASFIDEQPGIVIPDDNTIGIERILSINDTGSLQSIQVDLDLSHTYIGDLTVNLVSPQNTSIGLHNRGGGSSDNIIRSFLFNNHPGLQSLVGEDIQGNWKLQINDSAKRDIGKLNSWGLKILYDSNS